MMAENEKVSVTSVMNVMDEKIIAFLQSQTNMTIAVVEDNVPYCANCFYAFSKKENLLIFKSKPSTTHIQLAMKNNNVAGTIVPDALDKARIQGIQFRGTIFEPEGKTLSTAIACYYKKHPIAVVISGELWAIKLSAIKFTDNKLGFGKRLEWQRDYEGTH